MKDQIYPKLAIIFFSLCNCIEIDKENIQNIEQFKHKMLESLTDIIGAESL